MKTKIALITGANKGIGFETATQLGKLGYTVLIGSRDSKRGTQAVEIFKAQEIDAHSIIIDTTDSSTIRKAADEVGSKFGKLDVLINNAGIFLKEDQQPAANVPTKILRDTFDVNVFGLHEVVINFWNLLNRSEAARLVNVSSALGSLTLHANGSFGDFKVIGYDASKAAVNMMTVHYAHQWQGTPHKANTIHPGSVKTDMNAQGDLSVEEGARTSVRLATIGSDGPNGRFFHMDEELPW